MLDDKTTARPWVRRDGDPSKENLVAVVRGITIYGPYGAASCGADADLIVRAVNAHEELVSKLETAIAWIEEIDAYRIVRPHTPSASTILRELRTALTKAGAL